MGWKGGGNGLGDGGKIYFYFFLRVKYSVTFSGGSNYVLTPAQEILLNDPIFKRLRHLFI